MDEPLPSKPVGETDGAEESEFPFTPAPVRARHDGWTVERQYAFIEALAETGIVEEAARRVGMSDTSAYNLRRRPCGVHFRRAWEAALDYSLTGSRRKPSPAPGAALPARSSTRASRSANGATMTSG